jgi:hypothetical protein
MRLRLTETDLHRIIKESVKQCLTELDWKTYANATKKAKEWREENPYKYDRNRGFDFERATKDAFLKKYGLEDQYDEEGRHSKKGTINLDIIDGEPRICGSRDHDFGDENTHSLPHNVYHLSKEYGKDGGYGRTRMWDYAHETTPEDFFEDDELAQKFRDAEKEIDDFKSGKTKYKKGKGWD